MADDPKSTNQIQLLAKVEVTAGTFVALAAADTQGRIAEETTVDINQPTEPRQVARSTKSPLGSLPGEKSFGINVKQEINPSDTITDALENKLLIEICGQEVLTTETEQLSIGAVTSGPFVRNETITGGTSAATGRVLIEAADGASRIVYELLTGTFQTGEVLTGGTSAATATTSSGPSGAGHQIKPISASEKTASMEKQEDGYAWSIAGAVGNQVATFESSKQGIWDFAFQGPKNAAGDKAMTTGISYESEQPAIVQDADCELNGVSIVFSSVIHDLQNVIALRKSGNVATTGILAGYIPKRIPILKLSMELPPSSSLDVDALQAAGTKTPFKFRQGTTDGKIVYLFVDLAQITDVSLGEADGIRTVELTLDCTGDPTSSEDEYEFVIV